MLKREGNDILDSFEWRRAIRPSKSFSNDDLDPAVWVSSIPVSLIQNLRVESWKPKNILIAVPVNICYLSDKGFSMTRYAERKIVRTRT